MNTTKLSLLAVLALSSSVLRADIVDLSYTKADLASVEKTTALMNTCRSVYTLIANKNIPQNYIGHAFDAAKKVDEFTDAALEGDDVVNRIGRIADACAEARNKIAKPLFTEKWKGQDYAKMSSAVVTAVAEELAQGFATKMIKKNFADGDQKQRLYRRALYVGKNIALGAMFDVVKALTDNQIYGLKKVEGKEVAADYWKVAKDAAVKALLKSLVNQVIGEILISNAADDSATPIVLKAEKCLNII